MRRRLRHGPSERPPDVFDRVLARRETDAGTTISLGYPLLDDYLVFVKTRPRPNTWLPAAYDLKVLSSTVAKEPAELTAKDVFEFIKAQRAATRAQGRARGLLRVRFGAGVPSRPAGRRFPKVVPSFWHGGGPCLWQATRNATSVREREFLRGRPTGHALETLFARPA
jgi:hypothetical protein